MGNSCSPGCRWRCLRRRLFALAFFPLDVLDEVCDLIESVSEGVLTYSCTDIVFPQGYLPFSIEGFFDRWKGEFYFFSQLEALLLGFVLRTFING